MVYFAVRGISFAYRNPIFGDSNSISFQRINRPSRGGDLIIFRDNEWPTTEVMEMTFEFLLEVDYRRFMNMLREAVGTLLVFIDHNSRTWDGLIQNPEAQGRQTGRSTWQVSITFEGVPRA